MCALVDSAQQYKVEMKWSTFLNYIRLNLLGWQVDDYKTLQMHTVEIIFPNMRLAVCLYMRLFLTQ